MIAFYMDVHIRAAVTRGLRLRGLDVLTAQEDGTATLDDSALLDRATKLGRVLFSQDADLLVDAAHRETNQTEFSGVIYAHQQDITIGETIRDLAFLAENAELDELRSRVTWLPLA